MLLPSNLKWYGVAIAFVVYSVGLWHVSSTYSTATLVQAELERTVVNNNLATQINKKLDDDRTAYAASARRATKDMFDELLKDPRYKSCRTTDGVRDALQRKLDAQPK